MSEWRLAAAEHAREAAPSESCGLVVVIKGRERYWPCRNLAPTPSDFFVIDPEDYAAAEDDGEVIAIVHSHPTTPAVPSDADRLGCNKSGLCWYIVHPEPEQWAELYPSDYKAPLVGRQYVWGLSDCWTVVRDWYAETWGLELLDWDRPLDMWSFNRQPMFESLWADAGFVEVPMQEMQVGDALLMTLEDAPSCNHVAVYMGEQMILHHIRGRLSSRDLLNGYYQERTRRVLRHQSRCQ